MSSKKIFIIFFMFLGFLGFSFLVRAVIISQIYFTDFSIEKASFTAGEEIRGNFALWNYEKEVVPDITYSYKLLAQDSSGFYTIVLDEKFSGDNFSLKPDQKVVKSFSYRLSQNLPSGNHKFRIQLFNSKGLPMSRKDSDITIQSDNRFLTLENHFLLKNGEKFSPMGTAIYDAGQIPKIIFDISNKSSFQISASPRIVFYYYNITETPLRTIEKETITLSPGGSQNKTFDLIDFQEPGNYICRLTMYQNNEIISNSIDFRWKILGKVAEVAQVRVDKSSYEEGEEATVTTDVALKEESGELQVTIYDKDDKIVGEKKEKIALRGGQIEVRVPVTENVINPKIEIAVVDENQEILDKYEAQVRDGEIREEDRPRKKRSVFLIMGILVVIMAFIVYIWRKGFFAAKAVFMIVLVFSGIFLSANPVLALEEISSGPNNDTGIAWSAPLPGYLYGEGGYVPYVGHVQTILGAPLRNNNFEFFVAEPNEITTTTDADNVEVIDEANSEVISLGELGLSEEAVFVEYDKPVQIPLGLPENYLGEAWLCLQFKGENAITGDWHWIIACQEVIVQPEGEGCLYLKLEPGETEAGIGDEVTLTVETDSKCPCIRFDTDVILIMDISGSMSPVRKIGAARDGAAAFVDQMGPDRDQLALVTYETDSERRATLTSDYEDIKDEINGLSAGGDTCISCGINTANQEMGSERSRLTAIPYHILMTDGIANRCILSCTPTGCTGGGCAPGNSAYTEAANQASLSAAEGIVIYTIGFMVPSGGAAEDLMEDIADITGGQYFPAPTEEGLENVFKTIAGLLIGKSPGTTLEIDVPDNFVLTDYDSRCSYDGTTIECDIGDLDCGGTVMDPFKFTLELASGDPDEEIEIEATLSNDALQEKEKTAIVTVTAPDSPTNLGIGWEHCAFAFGELSVPTFRWETIVPHTGYNIGIQGATLDLDEEVDLFAPSTDSGYTFTTAQINWIRNNLLWGETYDWGVRIRENGQWSNWSWGQVTMPDHSYPRPDFSHSPEEPPAGEVVTFTDSSKCYSVPGNTEYDCKVGALDIHYEWDFDYIGSFTTDSTTKGNVTTTFSESGNYTVGLKITDNTLINGYFGNNYCIGTEDTAVTLPLPDYKEVAPVTRLDNFLARIANVFVRF